MLSDLDTTIIEAVQAESLITVQATFPSMELDGQRASTIRNIAVHPAVLEFMQIDGIPPEGTYDQMQQQIALASTIGPDCATAGNIQLAIIYFDIVSDILKST